MKTIRTKLIVIGPHNVGKTSIVTRYQSKVFIPQNSCTVGASFSQICVVADGCKVKMQVWDTAGQERFRSMAPMYFRGADGALLMYDVTSGESLSSLKDWSKDLLTMLDPDSLVLAVAGNKCDLPDLRETREKDGRDFAKGIEAQYFETSAKDNIGVNEVFEYFAAELAKRSENKNIEDNHSDEDVNFSKQESVKEKGTSSGCCG